MILKKKEIEKHLVPAKFYRYDEYRLKKNLKNLSL